MAIAWNQARKQNLERTKELKRRNSGREKSLLFSKGTEHNKGKEESLFGKDTERNIH